MANENEEVLDTSVQDDNDSTEVDNNGALPENDEDAKDFETAYLNQKERAEIAEAELKALRSKLKPEAKAPVPNSPVIDAEKVAIKAALKVQGMADELITELETIAKAKNVSMIDAQNDPWFVASKEKFEKEAKSKAASLGASRGSAKVQPKKDFTTLGMTREEHMAMIKSLR